METSFCLHCTKRSECKSICPELEKHLKKVEKHKDKRMTYVNPYILDSHPPQTTQNGKHKKPIIYGDNYEA